MERKLKMKEVKSWYNNIVSVGYCDLWYLLKCIDRDGYTSGVYGWNADVFQIGMNTCIVTGYRPFGNIDSNKYSINKEYNEKAKKIWNDNRMNYETKKAKVEKLLKEYKNNILFLSGAEV